MPLVAALLLLGPAETIAGKYPQHSPEFLERYPIRAIALPDPLPRDAEALCRLIESGHATPRLFAALGEALLARGQSELAYRAFDRAHRGGHPDPAHVARRKDACARIPDSVIRAEEVEAERWVEALQAFERSRIRRGEDPRDRTEFYSRFGRPEDDLYTIVRAHRLSWAAGVAGFLIGLGFAVASRMLRKRAAVVPLVAAALCLTGPPLVGMTGLFFWGAGFSAAGGAMVLALGRGRA
ncbi:MAG: hypothetical protein ACYTGV_01120 [Planctomycetota bacterium]|jgi:hypothetical protein